MDVNNINKYNIGLLNNINKGNFSFLGYEPTSLF